MLNYASMFEICKTPHFYLNASISIPFLRFSSTDFLVVVVVGGGVAGYFSEELEPHSTMNWFTFSNAKSWSRRQYFRLPYEWPITLVREISEIGSASFGGDNSVLDNRASTLALWESATICLNGSYTFGLKPQIHFVWKALAGKEGREQVGWCSTRSLSVWSDLWARKKHLRLHL